MILLAFNSCIKSLHCRSNGQKNPRVKHYQILQTETGDSMYYLAEKYLFSTIPELIHYHQHNAAGKHAGFPCAALLEGSKGAFVHSWSHNYCFTNSVTNWMIRCFMNME